MGTVPDKEAMINHGAIVVSPMMATVLTELHSRSIEGSIDAATFGNWFQSCLNRHIAGDWGDSCKEDRQVNDEAIASGSRIVSVYNIPDEFRTAYNPLWQELFNELTAEKVFIITEAGRHSTTVLFPSEY